jgi:hypothetical protein
VSYPANTITYKYNRDANTYRRSVSVEGTQRDASSGKRIAPKNVIVMLMDFHPLNDGSHKNRQEASSSARVARSSSPTAKDQGHVAEEQDHGPDRASSTRTAMRSR